MKLHLKKEDDGKGTGLLFETKKEYKVRSDNDLIFVKRNTLIVDNTKNTPKVPDKEISQSIQHNKECKALNNPLINTRGMRLYRSP